MGLFAGLPNGMALPPGHYRATLTGLISDSPSRLSTPLPASVEIDVVPPPPLVGGP